MIHICGEKGVKKAHKSPRANVKRGEGYGGETSQESWSFRLRLHPNANPQGGEMR